MEISGGVCGRAPELATDGVLCAGADRARRARTWGRGARRRCKSLGLGLRVGAWRVAAGPQAGRGVAHCRCRAAGRGAGGAAVRFGRGCAGARAGAGACDRAAGGSGRVPVDEARSAGGAVGRTGAQAGARTAFVRGGRCARRGRRNRGGPAASDAAFRACGERLPDGAIVAEGAPDALPSRALCGPRLRYRE